MADIEHFGGDGDAVVMLHGFGADRQSFTGNLSKLIDDYSVWGIDLPSHGNAWNVSPAIDPTQGLEGIAQQSEKLLTLTGADTLHLIGHSLGGAIALLIAANNPLVKSLTLIAPAGLGQGVRPEFVDQFCSIDSEDAARTQLSQLVHDQRMISPMIAPMLVKQLAKESVSDNLRAIGELVSQPNDPMLNNALNTVSDSSMRKLVVWGKEDSVNPYKPQDQEQFNAEWHVIPGCGHLPHIEHRIRFDRAVFDLLKD